MITYVKFIRPCWNILSDDARTVLCANKEKRKTTNVPNESSFSPYINCVFKGLRYLNADSSVNAQEIMRDFYLVNKTSNSIVSGLQSWVSEINGQGAESRAASLFDKLIGAAGASEDLNEAWDYCEIRSKNYMYALQNGGVYNRANVKALVTQIDETLCPSSTIEDTGVIVA
ncbi:37 kDa salivary gland allergen Aed a 2-like [Uranotaenia lowii]|uniref:37 kDa salivary gland allergen Aed a 2-like n=1 Tax=Uranotaenia lowii TaxID=190385 RepID=UPI002479DFA6|nr:37 kDa salivary gland allergen Aed a 2-like [Uranotaenia lowii]